MELIPTLEIGWLNGWILLEIEFLIQGFLLLIFPAKVGIPKHLESEEATEVPIEPIFGHHGFPCPTN